MFYVLTLTFALLRMFWHLSKLDLTSIADFSNTWTGAQTSVEYAPCLLMGNDYAIWMYDLVKSHGILSQAAFFPD